MAKANVISADCVIMSSLRLLTWSAITPPMSAKARIGMDEAKPTTPSQKAELVSCSTSQPWATFCIQVPMFDRKFPAQKRRKSSCRKAEAMRWRLGALSTSADVGRMTEADLWAVALAEAAAVEMIFTDLVRAYLARTAVRAVFPAGVRTRLVCATFVDGLSSGMVVGGTGEAVLITCAGKPAARAATSVPSELPPCNPMTTLRLRELGTQLVRKNSAHSVSSNVFTA